MSGPMMGGMGGMDEGMDPMAAGSVAGAAPQGGPSPEEMGLLIQLLRGLDNGMPAGLRGAWEAMTPGFQQQKATEQAQMQAQSQGLQAGGGEPDAAGAQAELQQYRNTRR